MTCLWMEEFSLERFYEKQSGKNIITEFHLQEFKRRNPELSDFLNSYEIKLSPIDFSHFESWTYWIISQQLNGRVADLLINRFRLLCGTVTPERVREIHLSEYKKIGISKSKSHYLYNIAQFHLEGKHITDFSNFTSEDIRLHYTQIKGIGPWTVNMFLIFNLGRLDVLAVNDLVVRKGIQQLYSLKEVPSVSQARQVCKKWGDLSTIGTLLSWEVMDS